ncbi:hypothetical protein OESDEN_04374 [Oesophagostomum dentatum]|uniref:AMP-dependent synthetase/ligase domain-containing protein n=1 Tax=Oesophagostomum dentatum TaxID=61180 RepID=A0A0B1TJX3_OESDE|nr:hypothetical protein OESDEN_04374 [Oesophagostomum dentatum]
MTGAMSPPFARTEDDKEMLVVPFYHCYGFGMMMTALLSGATSVLLPRFKPELFCSAIQEHKVRWLTVAPLILTFLARSPTCQNYDLSSLQVLFSGSAPAPKNVCEELIRKYENIKHVQQEKTREGAL